MTQERIASYEEFWPFYLRQHRKPWTRRAHYLGTAAGTLLLLAGAASRDWRLLAAAPVVGYACAWIGHFGIEGNRPATFGHPLWSLYSDFRMLALWLAGRLGPELDAAGVEDKTLSPHEP
ncbi:MAG: DUF962 domain-containing protein [Rhodospirillales bacterium]|nr:DUF962 domain-containing protein [Rhodospirillales bacterium]